MKSSLINLISTAMVAVSTTCLIEAAEFYVSPVGNDSNSGTMAKPFKTIQKAADVMKAGDRCLIRAGTYRETVTPANPGQENAPITFMAYEGEKVIISGCDVIPGPWKKHKGDIFMTDMPWTLGPGKDQVFVGGKMVMMGRHPNTHTAAQRKGSREVAPIAPPRINLPPVWMTFGDFVVTLNSREITSTSDLDQDTENYWKGAIYKGWHEWGWCAQTAIVESSKKGSITVKDRTEHWWFPDSAPKYRFSHHTGYLTHHLNTVDVPGEWYIQDGKLYMIPPENLSKGQTQVEAKKRYLAFNLRDRDHIVLKDLGIFAASITLDNANHCTIDGCRMSFVSHYTTFQNAGSAYPDGFEGYLNLKEGETPRKEPGAPKRGESGVCIGGKDNVIKNSVIKYSAGAGIILSGLRTTVTNNIIHNCGYSSTYVGGLRICEDPHKMKQEPGVRGGHTITYNEIYNAGRNLITFKGTNSGELMLYDPLEIKFNHIYNSSITANDTGSIYSFHCRFNAGDKRTQASHNVIWDDFSIYWAGLCYPDNGSFGMDFFQNILWLGSESRKRHYQSISFFKHNAPNDCKYFDNKEKKEAYDGGVEGLKDEDYPGGKKFRTGPNIKDDKTEWFPFPWAE